MALETKNIQVTGFPHCARVVTPSDTTDLQNLQSEFVPMYIRAESPGDITVTPAGNSTGQNVTFALTAGQFVPCKCRRVLATGTTAGNITGVW